MCDSGTLYVFCGIVPKLIQGRSVREVRGGVKIFSFSDTEVHYLSERSQGLKLA